VPKFGAAPKRGLGLKWKFRGEDMDRISEGFIYEKEMYVLDSIWSLEAEFRDYVRRRADTQGREG
jgi:hypothetical protein